MVGIRNVRAAWRLEPRLRSLCRARPGGQEQLGFLNREDASRGGPTPTCRTHGYRRPYMSGVTRTLTRSPSVARLTAARFSSRVLAVAGRLSSSNLSGLSGAGLPFVCIFATELMVSNIMPARADVSLHNRCPAPLRWSSAVKTLTGPGMSPRYRAQAESSTVVFLWGGV